MSKAKTAIAGILTKWHNKWRGKAECHDHVEYYKNPSILNSIPEVILTSLKVKQNKSPEALNSGTMTRYQGQYKYSWFHKTHQINVVSRVVHILLE